MQDEGKWSEFREEITRQLNIENARNKITDMYNSTQKFRYEMAIDSLRNE